MIGGVLFFAERFEERLHIFSMFLLISHNPFHHGARGGIVIAKVANDFVMPKRYLCASDCTNRFALNFTMGQ
jgi:hypothetical protein